MSSAHFKKSKTFPLLEVNPHSISALEISNFANRAFLSKCEKLHEDPKDFVAFILNCSGNLSLVSFASGNSEEVDVQKLRSSKAKDQIIHKHPVVLAKRGFCRYLVNEAKRRESRTSFDDSIFFMNDDGELQLRTDCHVYLYSTRSYICENVVMGLESLKQHDTNHCIMNKIRRWNVLGVQGAALSNVFSPIYISKFVYGTPPPIPLIEVWRLLFSKLGIRDRNVTFESVQTSNFPLSNDRFIVWFQGLNGLDAIGQDGKLLDGNGSSVCKEEVFKAFLQLKMSKRVVRKYSRAKKSAGHYQHLKHMLYSKWEHQKNGKWLERRSNRVDKFWIKDTK